MIDVFGERKKKITLDQEKFKSFFYTILEAISEEWLDLKNKQIEDLQKNIKIYQKDNTKLRDQINKIHFQNNNYIRQTNIVHALQQARILTLENKITELNK